MIGNKETEVIHKIWDDYLSENKLVLDTKGNELPDIDKNRIDSISKLKTFIYSFQKGEMDIYEFKTTIDSFNKRNNFWGFTATKGQMFFNQLVKNNEQSIDSFTQLLKSTIKEPSSLKDALSKIGELEKFCLSIFEKAEDRRKVPNPGSVNYFLSYFWQIHNHQTWPILYTSLSKAFDEIGLWKKFSTQVETYEYFFELNESIKTILSRYVKRDISNWDAEHAFWNFKGNPNKTTKKGKNKTAATTKEIPRDSNQLLTSTASFDLNDYLIPKVSKLVDLGNQEGKSSSAKGVEYEKLVSEIFNLLDFEVDPMGQGTGRNPDAILKYREQNTAFLVDAKAYSNGYSLGIDDRAIREYINHYCPILQKDGYKKIGFIIVSNSFKSNFDGFINEITWDTDIKRFILMSSEALLHLLAYKTKDRLSLSTIIESLIGFGNLVEAKHVIEEFDDV